MFKVVCGRFGIAVAEGYISVKSTIELARVEGERIKAIRPLGDEEVQEINGAMKEIFDFNRHFRLVEYVLHNFTCLKKGVEDSLARFAGSSHTIDCYDLDSFGHEVNINLLNLMMSARTFLDHMETFIKREYGKTSEAINLFKRLTAEEFDSRFSYKFMYKLRNYVQHCGMPPLSYSKSKNFEEYDSYVGITLMFDRDALISGFDGWGSIVKPQLESQDNKFDAFAIIEEFVLSILRIYIRFYDETKFSKTLEARKQIVEFIEQNDMYFEDDYCLLRVSDTDGEKVTFNMSWIPASLFRKMEHYLSLRDEI
ncbi:hypothetical protein [Celerinatantimonas sp. MCCC 1A17872]|uniref:hypothetical protein n=1 Tax=Celerinatantimonas sp. MCCC 1A17872 TaxID=3177514 RepID=UPI0038BFDB5C